MVVLLPKGDISTLEDSLTSENLDSWMSDAWEREVDVYLPKFKFETKYMLKPVLSDMGMPTAFSMAADLSGMDGTQNLYIAQVIHQAYVDVNEEGTEAAAATAVVVALKGMPTPPPQFRADHPFIFLIKENTNDMILFMGKVVDPTAE
jgi:serpin B